MARLLMVPRWAGDASSDFYPWLREELSRGDAPLVDEIVCSSMRPDKDAPTLEASIAALARCLEQAPATTHAIAHSAGCQVLLRGLGVCEAPALRSLLLVAPWFDLDDPWESIQPWCKLDFDGAALRARGVRVKALLSDDDPFTSDYASTRQILESELGAEVRVVSGAKHYNQPREEAVLSAMRELL